MKKYIQVRKSNGVITRTIEVTETHTEDANFIYISNTMGFVFNPEITHTYLDGVIVDNGLNIAKRIIDIDLAIKEHLDTNAQEKGYDSILTACSYAAIAGRYRVEGMRFFDWRTAVWSYFDDEVVQMEAGARTIPTLEEFLLELPMLVQ